MMTPAESKGCGGDDDISQEKPQYHREHYQQEESAPLTGYQQVANQMLTGIESVNRNHSLTSTASPSLPASADPQQSPRIGDAPPRRSPSAQARQYSPSETDALRQSLAAMDSELPIGQDERIPQLLRDAYTLALLERPAFGKAFNIKTGNYVERAAGNFIGHKRAWRWRIMEVARSVFLLILNDSAGKPIAKTTLRLAWECDIEFAQS